MKYFILICICLTMMGCQENNSNHSETDKKENSIEAKNNKAKIKLSDLNFMQGNWTDISGTFIGFNERWIAEGDTSFKVIGFTIKENDTVISEVIKVKFSKGILYYSPRVVEQNEGKEINFGLSSGSTTDSFAFTKYDHDFPREIIYKKSSAKLVKVYLNGIDENEKEIRLQLLLQKSN